MAYPARKREQEFGRLRFFFNDHGRSPAAGGNSLSVRCTDPDGLLVTSAGRELASWQLNLALGTGPRGQLFIIRGAVCAALFLAWLTIAGDLNRPYDSQLAKTFDIGLIAVGGVIALIGCGILANKVTLSARQQSSPANLAPGKKLAASAIAFAVGFAIPFIRAVGAPDAATGSSSTGKLQRLLSMLGDPGGMTEVQKCALWELEHF